MSIGSRLHSAEERLGERLLRDEARVVAAVCGLDADELYQEAETLIARYWHMVRPKRGGRLNLDPVLRAMAEDGGFDYDQLRAEFRQSLRRRKRK